MAISFVCKHCGKKLKAPDSAAGKSSTCPGCGNRVTCPERVDDAEVMEMVVEQPPAADSYSDLDDGKPYGLIEPEAPSAPPPENRRPCPMCGEMILATAAKCRYCGEVFGPTPTKPTKVGGRKRGKRAELKNIAIFQKSLLLCILAQIILWLALVATVVASVRSRQPPASGVLVLVGLLYLGLFVAGIAATVFAFLLALKVYSTGVGILMGILTLAPCLGLVVLLIINGSATSTLRNKGISVGLLGADMSAF
jgi:hypothetical protein